MKKLSAIILILLFLLSGCASVGTSAPAEAEETSLCGLNETGKMELQYAKEFSVSYYGEGLSLVDIFDTGRYLVIEEGCKIPEGIPEDLVIIKKPLKHTYIAASSAMDFYRQLGVLDKVEMTSTKYEDWSIPEVREALDREDMFYVGKYGTPDFEFILDCNCDLALESTMIYHKPETKEKLESLGIPVLVEHSSYEEDPLGRLEWIKLYGLLNDRLSEAEDYFESQLEKIKGIMEDEKSGKSMAFFYLSPSGAVVIRAENDYIAKMIGMAGADYIPKIPAKGDEQKSTLSIQMEDFYSKAADADILVYSSTVYGGMEDLDALFEQNVLFKDFRAVKEGNTWCTGQDMFQSPTDICGMTKEFNQIIKGDADEEELKYFYRLK